MGGDLIRVTRIAVFGRHGLLPEEAVLGQRFYISLEARVDLSEAGRSDAVAGTVSYADLTQIAVAISTEQRFNLIEALAEAIAASILERASRASTRSPSASTSRAHRSRRSWMASASRSHASAEIAHEGLSRHRQQYR
jgi:dihydroneopterin aldolase